MTSGPFKRAGFVKAESAGLGEVFTFRRPPLGERIRLILKSEFGAAGEGYPEFSHREHRKIGRRLRQEARLPSCVDPRWYCHETGLRYIMEPDIIGCGGEIYLPAPDRIVLYRPAIDTASTGFSQAHGLSHDVAERYLGSDISHAEVYLITMEIMCPADELEREGAEAFIARQPFAPPWIIRAYAESLRSVPFFR